MVIVKQLYCYTCTLACVQSFFADHNNDRYTQSVLIYSFPDLCFVNDPQKRIGAFEFGRLSELGLRIGFTVEDFPVGSDIDTISIGMRQAVFILTHKDDTGGQLWHCVRLKEVISDDVWIMNPSHGINTEVWAFDRWTKDVLRKRECEFKRLTLT